MKISEPQVVRSPAVGTRSFTESGTPCSGPSSAPLVTARSAARAASMAWLPATVMKAFSTGCARSIRSSVIRMTSTGETWRPRTIAASSAAER